MVKWFGVEGTSCGTLVQPLAQCRASIDARWGNLGLYLVNIFVSTASLSNLHSNVWPLVVALVVSLSASKSVVPSFLCFPLKVVVGYPLGLFTANSVVLLCRSCIPATLLFWQPSGVFFPICSKLNNGHVEHFKFSVYACFPSSLSNLAHTSKIWWNVNSCKVFYAIHHQFNRSTLSTLQKRRVEVTCFPFGTFPWSGSEQEFLAFLEHVCLQRWAALLPGLYISRLMLLEWCPSSFKTCL